MTGPRPPALPLIIPCVDIQSGRAVRLYEGDPDRETVYFESPLAAARHWAALGAGLVHLVDLDAATGRGENRAVIGQITADLGVPVEVGGGIRDREAAETLLQAGVLRVVIGTAAVKTPELVRDLIAAHGPERVVVSLDARGLEVATHGWAEGSGVSVAELTPVLAGAGLETLIFTDVTRDGTLKGLDRDLMRQVRQLWTNTLIVGGGVATLDDVRLLAEEGIQGAIVGRAIYEGTLAYPVTAL
ncbi:1-(5-phosphoribosyl)-5-[(5-phosphoribosylamino)methylideneamino]imidazole-4-carboxamide isomerase [Deinococcus metallilatus]|uniref:1-(5-phosphoribosyl)-5-[(5-phosphoribosylamino)methylideneamino] imidazole-4-carboxamide isomerase n=1 Tax=Deinococcus metallilatus TaxID=1211322 RepID=A0AAJ5F3D4_9DEIO|nr:1-(5-phosphoribosyl)-5-[(5-phosphoribosylamino)methylideneamino]imidazole-4-carboxamide isomerase [Deinococcus metallilatus]MBB5296443.1 phosphoribosylformimino-5-aminoimidazole carboxamide ribotide isomerase [Deinococcus metallilatus]QBY09887.1 1-(5-phosphoribosyl)-5-[(5-phosphoribosylamino)methylideneamino]imidazole-4-carboxamide isomerase [Deinococcus metallilatus]RXJ08611.1 1-(5-phosphoribosyl)-5-[(5-phosphoribosylamino)methylideneamino]imidazole-4-carboxamide isomerase [Deinococcus metal